MRSKSSRLSAASNPSFVVTNVMSQETPSTSSLWRITSASRGLSSKWSTRSGLGMSGCFGLTADLGTSTHDAWHAPRRDLVDHPPERAHLSHRLHEILELHRLHDIGVDAELVEVGAVEDRPLQGPRLEQS